MAKPLVIVESPAKAKTLSRFLGDRYRVEASFGHIRDLPERASEVPPSIKDKPWGRMAVDVDGDFTPYYVIPADKKKHIQSLKAALKDASEVLLATDPDREGESISWHLKEVLKPKVPVRRIVFHEITEDAVNQALRDAHDVDENLVRAQESRRILDRLYGYTLSPVLWKKVQTGLSAGRVQSVAVRLIVEREEERRRFRSASFWDLDARLQRDGREFTATLVRIGSERLASGKDFDPSTGALKEKNVRLLKQDDARALATGLQERLPWSVTNVEEKPVTQRPAPPFTTSTLQQEANRKLGYSAERTMSIAQRLFQGIEIGGGEIEGLITYHRTDSTTLSQKALAEAERYIKSEFGPTYYTGARQYQTKVRNAQEAHEAIRPTDFRQKPEQLARVLDSDELRLYELVWKRTIASQMADARLLRTTIEITATAANNDRCMFTATGKTIQFPGFLRAYVEGSDDPAGELGDQETILPACAVGDQVVALAPGSVAGRPLMLAGVDPKGHETTPPARYTEASLVKRLEEDGIGRPSTYAPTIDTIKRRGYVFQQGKALVPSYTAFAVTTLLRDHFSDYVDTGFTAEIEKDLDQISEGERESVHFLREFYRGSGQDGIGLEQKVQAEENISYPAVDLGADPSTGEPLRVRIGRYGPFVQRGEGGAGNTASIPDEIAPADFTVEQAVELLKAKAEGPRTLGADPATGKTVYLMTGRFGAYVQLGETPEKEKGSKAAAAKPKRASLSSNVTEATITLADALKLLSLPRELGVHPEDGQPIVANFGRFGPYVKHGDEFRSLESDDQVFGVTLDEAVALLKQPKRGRQRQATRTVLLALGPHPESAAQVQVLAGRYGPYVTDGTTNASLTKGADPAKLSMEEAVALLKAREGASKGRGPVRRRTGGGGGRKGSPRKKLAAAS